MMKAKIVYLAMALVMALVLVAVAIPQVAMAYPPTDGMVSYWKLNETSGTTASDSVDANPGTLTNGPVWTSGKVNGALSFDGADDYVNVPDSANLDITGAITVEAWIKPDTVTASPDWRAVVYKLHTSGTDKGGYGLFVTEDQSEVYFFTEAGGVCFASATLTLVAWNHVVGTYDDAGNIAIYVNGVYQDGGNLPGYTPYQTDRPLYIGGNPDDDGFAPYEFAGVIDEVAIYNIALTAEDVLERYNNATEEEEEEPGGCFIATAAYGTSSTVEIDVLRAFRDEVLLESTVGSQLVRLYYQTSPPIADFISDNSLLRTMVRELLIDPVVSLVGATETMWGD